MRNISADMIAEFSSQSVNPALLAELDFDSQTIGVWSGVGTLTWGTKTFLGGGNLIGVSPITETQDTEAKGIVVSLNGISSTLISAALQERCRGRDFRLYLASVSTSAYIATEDAPGIVRGENGEFLILENNLVDSPYRWFAGLMDTMEVTDNGESADIRLSVENKLIIGQRTKLARYTVEDQKKRFPTDKGLELINQLMDKSIVW